MSYLIYNPKQDLFLSSILLRGKLSSVSYTYEKNHALHFYTKAGAESYIDIIKDSVISKEVIEEYELNELVIYEYE